MRTVSNPQPQDLIGAEIIDKEGEKVGKVGNIYVADDTHQPQWATVRTGLFGHKESFLPLSGAKLDAEGLHVNTTKETVKEAPQMNADGHLSESEGMELYRYYGVNVPGARNPMQSQSRERQARVSTDQQQATARQHSERGQQRSEDNAMIRSEERLRVDTEQVETGRVRLRKYVVTEEQQMKVPLRHEEVRVEREPIKSDSTAARSARIGDAEQEVVLHAERPVTQTEAIPVEKVRLDTQTVTEQQTVSGQVRKEKIEIDDDTKPREK